MAAKVKKEGAEGRLALIEEGKIIKERLAQLEKELAQIEDILIPYVLFILLKTSVFIYSLFYLLFIISYFLT